MIVFTVCGVSYAMYRPLLRMTKGRTKAEAITKMFNIIYESN